MPARVPEAAIIADIIAGVNKVVASDDAGDVDFDGTPEFASNRGNKLKRKAAWLHEGQLAGKQPYKKRISHAGYERSILHRKPKRYDNEGYLLESDEEDDEADADAAERDPYHGVDVQSLLMPLTAASDLWNHPGMAFALTGEQLTAQVQAANEMLRKERQTLWMVKELATKLRGDHHRVPCSMMYTEKDQDLYNTDAILGEIFDDGSERQGQKTPEAAIAVEVTAADAPNGVEDGAQEEGTQAEDISMVEGEAAAPATVNGVAEAVSSTQEAPDPSRNGDQGKDAAEGQAPEVKSEHGQEVAGVERTDHANKAADAEQNSNHPTNEEEEEDAMQEDSPVPRMVTRGAAAAANGTSGHHDAGGQRSMSPASLPPVHPAFVPPALALPDRDLGLPPSEAEETRKVTNVFVQKQEEVVRGAERIYDMFVRAERLRRTVYYWSRAEAHAGEMSDGEEWVDQQEWGLDTPLKKGAAEGEEEGREEDRKGKGRRTRAVVG